MKNQTDIFAQELAKKIKDKDNHSGQTMIIIASAYLDKNFMPRKPEATKAILKEREDWVKGGGRLL